MPDHYYLELFAKPLATVPTTLRIRRTTYEQLNRIRGSRSERPPAIRVEYWPHSRTLKRLDIPEAP